jgi:hypothetical protein
MLDASLGKAQHHENLTIFPVLAEEGRELPYVLLADALAAGVVTIGEKDGGQVPLLLARNDGPDPILILDGEQLIGARQNRMTNRSILLAPNTTTEIPVSCMEHGRWHFVGDHFAPAPQHAPSKVRRKARETEVMASYAAEARGPEARSSYRDLASAQGEVWDTIRDFGAKLGGTSPTGALDSIYAHRRGDMAEWLKAYPLQPGQIGLLAFTGRVALGMDAVGSPALFAKLHQRILTGYVLDAMEGRARSGGGPGRGEARHRSRDHGQVRMDLDPGVADPEGHRKSDDPGWRPRRPTPLAHAERFVEAVRGAERTPSDSVGMGEYRILRRTAFGGELVNQDHLVHLSAFPPQEERESRSAAHDAGEGGPDSPRGTPIARPSQRKRRF